MDCQELVLRHLLGPGEPWRGATPAVSRLPLVPSLLGHSPPYGLYDPVAAASFFWWWWRAVQRHLPCPSSDTKSDQQMLCMQRMQQQTIIYNCIMANMEKKTVHWECNRPTERLEVWLLNKVLDALVDMLLKFAWELCMASTWWLAGVVCPDFHFRGHLSVSDVSPLMCMNGFSSLSNRTPLFERCNQIREARWRSG